MTLLGQAHKRLSSAHGHRWNIPPRPGPADGRASRPWCSWSPEPAQSPGSHAHFLTGRKGSGRRSPCLQDPTTEPAAGRGGKGRERSENAGETGRNQAGVPLAPHGRPGRAIRLPAHQAPPEGGRPGGHKAAKGPLGSVSFLRLGRPSWQWPWELSPGPASHTQARQWARPKGRKPRP